MRFIAENIDKCYENFLELLGMEENIPGPPESTAREALIWVENTLVDRQDGIRQIPKDGVELRKIFTGDSNSTVDVDILHRTLGCYRDAMLRTVEECLPDWDERLFAWRRIYELFDKINSNIGSDYEEKFSAQSEEQKSPRLSRRMRFSFTSSSNQKTVAKELLDEAIRMLSMEAGLIFLIDDKEENYILTAEHGFSAKITGLLSVLPLAEVTRRGLLPDSNPHWYRLDIGEGRRLPLVELVSQEGFQGVGYTTLMLSGKVFGVMVLATRQHRKINGTELELMAQLADTTALNLYSMKIMERDRHRAGGLEEVLETSMELGHAGDCEEIAKILAVRYVHIARAAYCSVALLTNSGKSLQLRAMHSISALEECKQLGIMAPLDDMPLLKKTLNNGGDILVEISDPCSELNDKERELLLTRQTKTAIILPLLADNEAVGIVAVGEERRPERNSFNEDTINIALILARQAGIAIENVKLLQKLKEEKRFIDLLVQNAAVLILVIDEHGKVEIMNRAAELLTGLQLEKVAGKDVFELLFPQGSDQRIKEILEISVNEGETISFLDDMKTEDGKILQVQWSCTPLEVEGKNGTRMIMVGVDNTEAVQGRGELERTHLQLLAAHKELKVTIEKLQRAYSAMIQQDKMAAIGQLAAGMAHEINNPNAYVLSNLSTLEEYVRDILRAYNAARGIAVKYAPNEEIEHLEKTETDLSMETIRDDYKQLLMESREGAARIAQLVNELRAFAGDKEKHKNFMYIGDTVRNCLNVIKNRLKFKASIEMNIPPLSPISGNSALLGQALFNIMNNAADFFDENKSPQNKLKIEAWEEKDYVVISIEDNGPGINPEHIGRIFEPFFTTKEVGEGVGMGLAVAYDIVRKHDGFIEVKSKLNEGTQFILRFPRATLESEQEKTFSSAGECDDTEPRHKGTGSGSKM